MINTITIRRLIIADLPSVERIEAEEFYPDVQGEPLDRKQLTSLLVDPEIETVVADSWDGTTRAVLGYCVFSKNPGLGWIYIDRIATYPQHAGIGTILIDFLKADLHDTPNLSYINVGIRETNDAALESFTAWGFERCGQYKRGPELFYDYTLEG